MEHGRLGGAVLAQFGKAVYDAPAPFQLDVGLQLNRRLTPSPARLFGSCGAMRVFVRLG